MGAQDVGWNIIANHGGGYAYRLCPKSSNLTEACFQRHHLEFAQASQLHVFPRARFQRIHNGRRIQLPPAGGTSAGRAHLSDFQGFQRAARHNSLQSFKTLCLRAIRISPFLDSMATASELLGKRLIRITSMIAPASSLSTK